jgi:hypothetical protein
MNFHRLQRYPLFASLIFAGVAPRAVRAVEPQWFRLNGFPQASVGLEVEGSSETTHVSGGSSTYDTLFITPTIGLRTSGSIYHPNLIAFNLDGELGWGWDWMNSESGSSSQTRNDSQQLNRYLAQINFFQAKPYNANFFAARDHTYRDYGSFESFTVDSERYGGRVGWTTEALSLNTDFGYRDEKSSGLSSSSGIQETYLNFLGINHRHAGQTSLTFRVNEYDSILNFGNRQNSFNTAVGLSDSETFGQRRNLTAATAVSVSRSEYIGQPTDTINATENVSVNHRPNLDSYLIVDYAHNKLQSFSDDRVQGVVGLRHQLYESLTSNFDVHGNYQENSGDLSDSSSDRYGLGIAENYTKRLHSWGRLTVNLGVIGDHEDDHSSGSIATTIDESHQLYLTTSPSYHPVYLDQPRVIPGSVQVTAGSDVLVEGDDYQLVTAGELTEVQLITPPGVHLQSLLLGNDNLAIKVTYQSESLNNASYDSLNVNFQVRLDLYELFGLYGRVNWMDNNASSEVLVQSLTDLVVGADYHWRWLRLGAEGEDYDSNYTKYQALRFYENFDFRIDPKSSLNFGFNETFYRYTGGREQNQYQFLARYNHQFTSVFSWYVEGGVSVQQVLDTDQLQTSARTGINWTRGKLSLRAGYEFNSQNIDSGLWTEERIKHRLFAYMKRTF